MKDTANTLADVVSGKNTLGEMKPEQLAALGGTPDPIDTEDFSAADFGNEVTAPPSDDKSSDEVTEETKDEETEDESSEETKDETDDGETKDDESEDETDETKDDDEVETKDDESEDETDETKDDESEDETDETDETDEEPAGKKGKDQRVPLDRFRKVNKRMREAEARLQQLEAEIAAGKGEGPKGEDDDAPPPYDFDKAELEYQDLVLDNKRDEAVAKRKEIRAAERAELKRETAETSSQTVDHKREAEMLDLLAVKYESKYPEMSKEHENFDPDVLVEVDALMTGYIAQGEGPSKAFAKALDRAAKNFGLKPFDERGETPPKGEKKGEGKGKPVDKKNAEKNKGKAKEKAKAAKGAPPDTTKTGSRGDPPAEKKSVEDMTDEEFDALPKSTLARLRGDTM